MSNATSVKITLRIEDSEGLPVSSESLWFDKVGKYYKLKNIPFFIENVSFDDLLELKSIGHDEYLINKVIERSGNSTLWINIYDNHNIEDIRSKLVDLSCGVEGGIKPGFFTVNVPKRIDIRHIYNLLDPYEDEDILVIGYPSNQHEE